jgi:hypothetical protein
VAEDREPVGVSDSVPPRAAGGLQQQHVGRLVLLTYLAGLFGPM